jgi:hypothetical protein
LSWKKKKKNRRIKRAGGVAQGLGPEFKPQYHQKAKKVWLLADGLWEVIGSWGRNQWIDPWLW